jgi:signal transduction histidine kinase
MNVLTRVRAVAAVPAIAAVGAVAVALTGEESSTAVWAVTACATVLPAIASFTSIKKGRRIGGREGLAWITFGLSMAMMTPIYLADQLDSAIAEYTFVVLAYALGATAAVIVPLPAVDRYQRVITSLDSLSIGVVVATGTFWVVSRSDLGHSSTIMWVVADAAIMAMIGYIAMRRGQGRRTDWPLFWLVLGTAGYLGGTLISAISATDYQIGHPADYAYMAGMMAFALAPTVRDTVVNSHVLRPVRWSHVIVPYYFVAALTIMLVFHLLLNWRVDPTGTIVVLGLLITMVIAVGRQLAMIAGQRRKIEIEQRGVIATVSHELRTPLTSIVGFLDMLEAWDSFPEDEKIEMVTLMRGQSHVLARVVDDLVSVARSEIDSTNLTRTRIHAADLLGYAVAGVPELDHVHASFEILPGLELDADRERMIQIVTNFLSNAVNYGNGEVAIVAHRSPQGPVIEVHDNGPGVPDLYEIAVWERFERGPQRQSAIPGSGIGLSVARGIARAHGGDAQYRRSERLGGSCFSVVIPDPVARPLPLSPTGTARPLSRAWKAAPVALRPHR